MVRTQGTAATAAISALDAKFRELAARDLPIVIYKAPFDWSFVRAEANRHDVDLPWFNIIDPLVCDRALDKYRRGSRTLAATAALYEVDLGNAHDAAADAVAAVGIVRALAAQYPVLRNTDLSLLQTMQAKWHSEWATGYEDYLRTRRGERNANIDKGWPIPDRAASLRP